MAYYIPLPCCECTPSTNPCDLPCLISAAATIEAAIEVVGNGVGNRIDNGAGNPHSEVAFSFNFSFDLNDYFPINSSGFGQAGPFDGLFIQSYQFAAGVNCPTFAEDCSGSIFVDGIPTFGLDCPANVCIEGQDYTIGTSVTPARLDLQETNCFFSIPPDDDGEDHIMEYVCDERLATSPTANVQLQYTACSTNHFTLISSQEYDEFSLTISSIQSSGAVTVGSIFIDNLAPQPLYASYVGPIGLDSKIISGTANVVIDRTIGYINENQICVPA
jgi:hypothetical protein